MHLQQPDRLYRRKPLLDLAEQLIELLRPTGRLQVKLLFFMRFAVGVMTKHLAQLLYIVHCGSPWVSQVAKPDHGRCSRSTYGLKLIRNNEVFLSLFCFAHASYSAATWNRGRTEHEHSNNRAGL